MKRWLFTIILLLAWRSSVFGQDVESWRTLSATGADSKVLNLTQTAAQFFQLACYPLDTVTTGAVKVEKSANGTSGWSDFITDLTCTTATGPVVSAATTGQPAYVRAYVTTLTGGGRFSVGILGTSSSSSVSSGAHVITDPTSVTAATIVSGTVTAVTSVTNPVTVVQPTGSNLHVVVDSGGGGGTQYDQGTVSTIGQTGTVAIADRRDTAAAPSGVADGDRISLSTNNVGALWTAVNGSVTVTDGAGALNTIVDSGTLTAVTAITNPVTVTDGAGALNTIVDSGTITTVGTVTTVTNPVTVKGGGAVVGESVAVRCVNAANGAFESCAGAGTTDTDDGTVAGGQTATLTIAGNYAWNGANWIRAPLSTGGSGTVDANTTRTVAATDDPMFGPAGTPSTEVQTIQGISGGTPLLVHTTGVTVVNSYGTSTPTYTGGSTDGDIRVDPYGSVVYTRSANGITVVSIGTTATVVTVSSAPAALEAYHCTNSNSTTMQFVQMFDTTGTPTLGTAQAWIIGLPPNGGAIPPDSPIPFRTGIKIAATTTASGNTGAGAGEIVCSFKIKQ